MQKNRSFTKRLCRVGVIAALYAVLTYVCMPFAFGPFQIRPAEALCLLPLFFPEAVPALFIGCALSNIVSPFAVYDVIFGSLATLIAAFGTFWVGKICKKDWLKITLGGLFPVLVNALVLPFIVVILCGGGAGESLAIAYFSYAFWIFLSEGVWVYALGTPLYLGLKKITGKRR